MSGIHNNLILFQLNYDLTRKALKGKPIKLYDVGINLEHVFPML
jgi:hypothetical protein